MTSLNMHYKTNGGDKMQEVWWSSGQSLPLNITRPGFKSRPGEFPQCGPRGGRSHCNTVHSRWAVNLQKERR